jgi:hypothetical protein
VATQSGTPVPGAFLDLGASHFETDAGGRFTLTAAQSAVPSSLSIGMASSRVVAGLSGPYVTHVVALDVSRSRDGVRLDIIEDTSPFSSAFYRELARDARDTPPGNRTLRPWTMAPSFYIRTTHVESGAPIPTVIVDELSTMLRNSVPELTGGRLSVAAIDSGPEARPATDGWINVLLLSNMPTPGAGGQATVGGNSGTMWLSFDPANPKLNYGGTSCSFATGAAEHEVVHSMGFYHVSPPPGVDKPFQSPDFCHGRDRPEILRYHAAIAYARPVGNAYPDVDPLSFLSLDRMRAVIVSCPLDALGRLP